MHAKGQTIIEMLVALSAAIIVITAIVVIVISSLSSVTFSKNQTIASQMVEQGVEVIRRMKDQDWATFSTLGANAPGITYCLAQNCLQIEDTPTKECWIASSVNNQCERNIATAAAVFTRKVVLESDLSSCNPPTPTPPSLVVEPLNSIKATIIVQWSDSKCGNATNLCHQVQYASCFANLHAVAGP